MSESAAVKKLVHVLGRPRAESLIAETLRQIGRRDLAEAESRLLFGHALTRHGGVVEAIGRAIKIQAILEGASEAVIEAGARASRTG
jgi:hypothetical protein